MHYTYEKDSIKIDDDDHYFIGKVDKQQFPEVIREDFEDIIEKSFNDYQDNNMTIKHNFNEDSLNYTIEFSYHQKPIFLTSTIQITMERHDKDFKDYMNERVQKLEAQVATLTQKLESLSSNLIDDNKSEKEESVNEESEDDSEEEIVIPVPKRKQVTKQTKKY